jgi:hypothetical protein
MPRPSVTTTHSDWGFQNYEIERLMDHAALTSAHPDNTLIMAGPPRYENTPAGEDANDTFWDKLLPLGMVQNFQCGQNLPVQPMMAVGSSRSFYLIGKAQGSASISRLFCNGRNLFRALSTNLKKIGVDPTKLDDPAANSEDATAYFNMDSELFRVPLGLACFFYDKLHNGLGAFYLELCQIQSWAMGWGAGQTMIMENVNLLFDRLYPISTALVTTQSAFQSTNVPILQQASGSGTDLSVDIPTADM